MSTPLAAGPDARPRFWSFNGRMSRLAYTGASVVWLVLLVSLVALWGQAEDHPVANAVFYASLAALVVFGHAPTARRLHDLGHSGWWQVPMYVPAVFVWFSSDWMALYENFFYLAILLAPGFYLYLWPGQTGENRHGPPPA